MSNTGKNDFQDLVYILSEMEKLNIKGISEDKTNNKIIDIFYNRKMLPLPSGDFGNSLALALQMNYYVVAKHILEHHEEYGVNLETCAISKNGEVFDISEVFSYSLEYFDDEEEIKNYEYNGQPGKLKEISYYFNNLDKFYKINELERNIQAKNFFENYVGWKSLSKVKTIKTL